MKKDPYDSRAIQPDNHSDSHEEQSRAKYTYKQARDEDLGNPSRYSREKQKTTAIALSVITCLFMCVIGYEIIRESQPDTKIIENTRQDKNTLSLSKTPSLQINDFLSDDYEPEDYESVEIIRLREKNRMQANKIKALRQELLEKMQASHEIKSNLFKIEGDPKDKNKINELTQHLEETVNINHQLGMTIKHLENELTALSQKINHTEVTRDALAAMLANHQTTKEQEIDAYKNHLNNLQEGSVEERKALESKLAQLEETQKQLMALLENKSAALEDLEERLSTQKELYSLKSKDFERASNLYMQTQEEMKEQLLALTYGMEWESTAHAYASKELTEISNGQTAEIAYVINLFESALHSRNNALNESASALKEKNNRIAVQDDLLTMHEQQLNAQRKLIDEKKEEWEILDRTISKAKQSEEKAQEIIATLEWEMTRSEILENELKNYLREHRYTLQERNDKIQKLERELNRQQSVMEAKSAELELLIDNLNKSLTYKDMQLSIHQTELKSLLEVQASRDEQAKQHVEKLLGQIHKESQQTEKMENALAQALAIAEIGTVHATRAKESEHKINDLTDKLSQALVLAEIGAIHAAHVEEIEQQVHSLKNQLTLKENHITQLEKKKYALEKSMENALAHALTLGEVGSIHAARAEETELQLSQLNEQLSAKEGLISSLESKRHELEKAREQSETILNKHINELNQSLEQEIAKLQKLEEDLQQLNVTHEYSQNRAQKTEKKLNEVIQHASRLDGQLNAYHESLMAKELEIQSILQAKSNVEDSMSDQINQLLAKIEQEKFKSESIHHNYREVKNERNNHADKAQKLENKYQLASLRIQLLEDEIALNKPLIEAHKEMQQRIKQLELELSAADEGLALQKEKNIATEQEMKNLIKQHAAEQEKSKELEKQLQSLTDEDQTAEVE